MGCGQRGRNRDGVTSAVPDNATLNGDIGRSAVLVHHVHEITGGVPIRRILKCVKIGSRAQQKQERPESKAPTSIRFQAEVHPHPVNSRRDGSGRNPLQLSGPKIAAYLVVEIHMGIPLLDQA